LLLRLAKRLSAARAPESGQTQGKSPGTNAIHGNLFEYTRNYLFNGRSATALVRDSLKQNQFGGTVGGAIIRNRLFYFGGVQGTIKKSNPANQQGYSMTPAMMNGDFSVVTSTACQTKAIVLTAPFVNKAHNVLVCVTGAGKAKRVSEVLEGPREPERLPIQLIAPTAGAIVWLLDVGAAGMREA